VVAWHVLEHLADPVAALRRLHGWTVPDGWLALALPDASAPDFRIFGAAWYALQVPTHLYHFTPSTLRRVLDRAGWRVERVFWQRNPNNLLETLREISRDRGWLRIERTLTDVLAGRRYGRLHVLLGALLGRLRWSGRITAWARRIDGGWAP
jgi:hypothetical protein